MTKLHSLYSAAGATGDVIFVHGLAGHPLTTWGFDTDAGSWSTWLAADRPDINVWSLEYEVSASAWKGHAMPLADRAINVLAVLDGAGIGTRPICFAAHSLGGLLVKQLLRHASSLAKEYLPIVTSTRGIVFFSTPHAGAGLASLVSYLQFLLRATIAVQELEAHDPRLRELNLWYRNNTTDLDIDTRVFFETRETRGVLVVNATSADPGIASVTPIPIDSNHFDICCPSTRDDLRYIQVLKFVNQRLPFQVDRPATAPQDQVSPLRQRLLSTDSPRELRRLQYEAEQLLKELPGNPETREVLHEIRGALESGSPQHRARRASRVRSSFALWPGSLLVIVVLALALVSFLSFFPMRESIAALFNVLKALLGK